MKDHKVIIHNEDSYKALCALTPPLIKRGLVLCDPSYEDADDYKKVCDALKTVRKNGTQQLSRFGIRFCSAEKMKPLSF